MKVDTRYVCPMCSGVVSAVPGNCPKCGMSLVPEMPSAEEPEDLELSDMRRRLRIALVFTVPLVMLEMTGMLGKHAPDHSPASRVWLQLLLAAPVVLWCGWPLLQRGWQSVRNRHLNMFTLIALGVSVAFLFSVFAVVAPSQVPQAFSHGGHAAVYFESAAVIVTLVLLGQVLELSARGRTNAALRSLLDLVPRHAIRVAADGSEQSVDLSEVLPGDILRVRPGDKVPVDGALRDGLATLDESMVTGESVPVERGPGDPVIGGTVNGNTSWLMIAQKVGEQTLLSRIVHAVAEAQRSRAPVQALADRVAGWFVPAVILISLVAAVLWWWLGPQPRLAYALVVAVSTLIIACPCALGLATPMSMTVALGKGAQSGVLFRDAAALEVLNHVDTVVFDKTGTLTIGHPELQTALPVDGVLESELLRYAASMEQGSEHPLAAAIVRAAKARGLKLGLSRDFVAIPGAGAFATVQMSNLAVGNARLMRERGVDVATLESEAQRLRDGGQTVVFVAVDQVAVGLLGLADPLKPEAWEVVRALRAAGLRILMVSGDHATTAQGIAQQLDIAEVIAEVPPERKAAVVQQLRSEGRSVLMIGDGINDAPALAAADVGVAMGGGTDIARQTAGVTLVSGDLRGLLRAIHLSEATMRNIRQNLLFAFGYNALGVPIAAGLLFPLTGWLLTPSLAAAAMSLSSVSVIVNALRLRNARI